MKPALTVEEWRDRDKQVKRGRMLVGFAHDPGLETKDCDERCGESLHGGVYHGYIKIVEGDPQTTPYHVMVSRGTFHALAALCLLDQPFGFTREDVDGLRIMMRREGPRIHLYGSVATLADRIEALLPPEEES